MGYAASAAREYLESVRQYLLVDFEGSGPDMFTAVLDEIARVALLPPRGLDCRVPRPYLEAVRMGVTFVPLEYPAAMQCCATEDVEVNHGKIAYADSKGIHVMTWSLGGNGKEDYTA